MRITSLVLGTTALVALALLAARGGRADPAPRPPPGASVPRLACVESRSARPRRWRFGLEVEGAIVGQSRNDVAIPGDTGTRFALDDLTGAGPFAAGRVSLEWHPHPRHGIRLTVAPLSFSGTDRLAEPVSFDGTTFAAGVPTEASYRFHTYRLTWRYRLVCRPRWNLRLGLTALVRDAEIGLEQGPLEASKTDLGLVPLLHVAAEFRLAPRWRLTLDADGLAAEQGRALDAALKVHYDLSDRWNVAVGYRTVEGGADNDEVYTFAWLHEAVVSVGFAF